MSRRAQTVAPTSATVWESALLIVASVQKASLAAIVAHHVPQTASSRAESVRAVLMDFLDLSVNLNVRPPATVRRARKTLDFVYCAKTVPSMVHNATAKRESLAQEVVKHYFYTVLGSVG